MEIVARLIVPTVLWKKTVGQISIVGLCSLPVIVKIENVIQ